MQMHSSWAVTSQDAEYPATTRAECRDLPQVQQPVLVMLRAQSVHLPPPAGPIQPQKGGSLQKPPCSAPVPACFGPR